jgi:hypothetical protein
MAVEDGTQPRFIVVAEVARGYVERAASGAEDPDHCADLYTQLSVVASKLEGLAQDYDFTLTRPNLAENRAAMGRMGKQLLIALNEEGVPTELKDIFVDFYGEELQAYDDRSGDSD